MLRILLFILAGLWLIPRLMRLFLPRRPAEPRVGRGARRRDRRDPAPDGAPDPPDRLRDLTQQDISDADFEEIPPED